jgi:cation diffusion facilitator family transporter
MLQVLAGYRGIGGDPYNPSLAGAAALARRSSWSRTKKMAGGFSHIPVNERRAALLALVISIALVIAKFTAYAMSGSAAVFADALESIVNVVAAAFAMYSLTVAHTPADSEHPYGHGKIEFFSGGLEGCMIVIAAIAAMVNGIIALVHGRLNESRLAAVSVVLIAALAVNGLAGLYLVRIGKKASSVTLEADGKHLLSDAVSSIFALTAIMLVRVTGHAWLDPLVAIIVAFYIAGVGIALIRHAAAGLMDRQDRQDQLLLEQILDSHLGPLGAEPHICSYHKLRHRHSGRYHWVDFHIMVPADWEVRRGHEVASAIEYEIEQALGEGNATAHIEPCKDHVCDTCKAFGAAQHPH